MTLFTFWPPGPEDRENESVSFSLGRVMSLGESGALDLDEKWEKWRGFFIGKGRNREIFLNIGGVFFKNILDLFACIKEIS